MNVKDKVEEEARRQSKKQGRILVSPSMAVEILDLIVEDSTKFFADLRRKSGLKIKGKAFSANLYDLEEVKEVIKEIGGS